MKRNRIFFLLGNLSKIFYKGNKEMASSLQSRIKQNILCKNGTEAFSRQDSRLLFFSA
jgi:formylmethanofuran:tetrahydromethanopterin formyltransferase